jgi:hypothetical protein
VSQRLRGVEVELQTNLGTMANLVVELRNRRGVVAARHVAQVGPTPLRVVLRDRGQVPPPGRYAVDARRANHLLAQRAVVIGSSAQRRLARFAR